MRVVLQQAGKRFEGRTIFEGVDLELAPGDRLLISGPNGAGKSTLLKLIAGFLRPSEGSVEHYEGDTGIDPDRAYRNIALAAPYLQFPKDLTVSETIRTWERFRPLKTDAEAVPEKVALEGAKDRPVRELSSGMEQRLKLGIAFASSAPLLLLDEPLTNIDAQGRALYQELLKEESEERAILVCSNDPEQEGAQGCVQYELRDGVIRSL